jgi:hypothetical protein
MSKLAPLLFLAGLLAAPASAGPTPLPTPTPSVEDGPVPGAEVGVPDDAPCPRWSVDAGYVLWWLREGRLPPTLTTSSQASRGLLGRPDTQILYGDDRLETRHGDRFNGLEAAVAYWLDDARTVAVEGTCFFLERDSTHFLAESDGSTLLARPYELPDGSPASAIIAGRTPAGTRSGAFVGYSRIELFGEALHLLAPLYVGDTVRVEVLGGARFLQLRDRTDLTASGRSLPDEETLFGLEDHYRVANAYYGAEAGLRGELTGGRWSLQLRGTVGLGGNDEQVRAFGERIVQTPAGRVVTPAGLTVQASDRGTFSRAAVNFVSEAGFRVGYRLTDHLRAFGGYTFLLWDGALRSGDQVDTVINPVPGTAPARPAIPFKEDVFWAQGLDAGLELCW